MYQRAAAAPAIFTERNETIMALKTQCRILKREVRNRFLNISEWKSIAFSERRKDPCFVHYLPLNRAEIYSLNAKNVERL
jgi:hypothetical protein